MAYRVLEVTLLSAKNLKKVNTFTRMEVYAVVSVSGSGEMAQCTQPDPYGGRHPSWNATFRFNVPATAADAGGCLHVLLRTERARGDRDVGEVIVPLADLLAGACVSDSASRPPQFASYQVRKVHRQEPRGTLYMLYRLGPVVAPPPTFAAGQPFPVVDAYPVPTAGSFYPPQYAYPPLPPPPEAAAGHVALPPPANGKALPPPANGKALPPEVAAGHVALPPPANGKGNGNGKLEFGMGLGAGLVGGAIGGMLAGGDVTSDRAAYDSGYRAGLAAGGAAVYKNSRVDMGRDRAEPGRPVA